MSPVLGIVCGMEAEAVALGGWRDDPAILVGITAGRPDRAEAEAERIVGRGVRALLSWGIAGGLDPALRAGDLVIADGVIFPGGRPFAFEPGLVAACRAGMPPAPATYRTATAGHETGQGRSPGLPGMLLLAGSDAVLFTTAAKVALRRRSGAAAVDMESHRIAAVARRARLPSLAVRAVSDTASRRLPALAADALDEAGRPRAGAVMRGLLRRPWDLPALFAAGRDSRAALAALSSAADGLVPALLAALGRPAGS
jgi:adenosylhomocysteine nucleosidase